MGISSMSVGISAADGRRDELWCMHDAYVTDRARRASACAVHDVKTCSPCDESTSKAPSYASD